MLYLNGMTIIQLSFSIGFSLCNNLCASSCIWAADEDVFSLDELTIGPYTFATVASYPKKVLFYQKGKFCVQIQEEEKPIWIFRGKLHCQSFVATTYDTTPVAYLLIACWWPQKGWKITKMNFSWKPQMRSHVKVCLRFDHVYVSTLIHRQKTERAMISCFRSVSWKTALFPKIFHFFPNFSHVFTLLS